MDVKLKRNIAVVGHAHSGKTSLVESILFVSGAISRKGDVAQSNTISDFQDDEKERKISINASFMKAEYDRCQIQIIDTPGYMDFIGETVASLSVSDASVVVVDAVNGVEVGTEDIWKRLDAMRLPRIIFVNKTDKDDAKLDEAIASIQEQLSKSAVVIDLSSSELVDVVAESDDKLLEKYLETGSLSAQELRSGLRKSVLEAKVFPIFTGSALTDKGVKELLDAVAEYLPCPYERPALKVIDRESGKESEFQPKEGAHFTGFVFKSMFDPHLGSLSMIRVFSGSLKANTDFYNVSASVKEHAGMINVLQGKEQSSVNEAVCGDIVALPKLKHTHVGHTIAEAKQNFVFAEITFPAPSISASIKPKSRADEDKISGALSRLTEEDHTFKVQRNDETKELIVSGIGDLHLKVMLGRMKSRYHVDVELGTPKVSYRETITKPGTGRYKHKKQSGGHGQYGEVELHIEPLPLDGDQDYEFINKIFGGAIPKNYIPSVEKGVKQTIKDGVLAGYPIDKVRVTVVDGSYHEVDSSDMAFQIAASHAMKLAVESAAPVLLEPIMEVTIVIPDEFVGAISGDISSRRGRIMGSEARGKNQIIKANVPLAEMFTYANDLRSITGGRGSYSMKTSHYEQVPSKITEQIKAKAQQG